MKKNDIFCITLLIIFCGIFLYPFLVPFNTVLLEESALQWGSYPDNILLHLSALKGLPLWSFHFGGGYPFFRHPGNPFLSPLFYLLIVPFGSVIGSKLMLLFSYLAGIIGCFVLARRILRFNSLVSFIVTAFFIYCSYIPYQVYTGNYRDHLWFCLPLTIYTIFASKRNKMYIFYSASLLSLLIFTGFSLYVLSMILCLTLLVLCDAVSRPENRFVNEKTALYNYFVILALTLLFSAVRIIPIFEILTLNNREFDWYLDAARYAMTFKKWFLALCTRGPYVVENKELAFMKNNADALGVSCVMYFGVIPTIMAVIAAVKSFARMWKFVGVMLIFVCISMANNSPIDIFHILWKLPLFRSMHIIAMQFSFQVTLVIAILVGEFLRSRRYSIFTCVLYVIIFICLIDVFIANRQYYREASNYLRKVQPISTKDEFFNVSFELVNDKEYYVNEKDKLWSFRTTDELRQGIQFYLQRQNIGLINWYGNLDLAENAVPRYKIIVGYGDYLEDVRGHSSIYDGVIPNVDYRGECYFKNHKENSVKSIQWNTNEIIIDVMQKTADVIIINQNYAPEWRCDEGEICNDNGVLAVLLPNPKNGIIKLRYKPVSFYWAALISVVSFMGAVVYFARNNKVCHSREKDNSQAQN